MSACEWALQQRADVVNLSLGTTNTQHEGALASVVSRLRESGAAIIAAGPQDGVAWLPGSLPRVWSVTLDWALPREHCRVVVSPAREVSFAASGFPRPIPGVPPEKNLKGLSFAVANVSGLVAELLATGEGADPVDVLTRAVSSGWMG